MAKRGKKQPVPFAPFEEVAFRDLAGEFELTGCDYIEQDSSPNEYGEIASSILFVLNGQTYKAMEDRSDGYRSSLKTLQKIDSKVKNTFKPCRVVGKLINTSEQDLLSFADAETGFTVLEVGTNMFDEYYPSFVGNFTPEHMSAFVEPVKTKKGKLAKSAAITDSRGPDWGWFE